MKRLVLLLTPTHIAALCWSNQGARPLAHFNHDAAGQADLAQFAQEQQRCLFYVLTDLGEEDFQQEVIPHLARKDQQRLIARKLEQRYRGTTYRYGQVFHQGGQQDQLQLSALLNEAPLDALISTLLAANCAIAGVYSVALLTENLLKECQLDRTHLLIMSRSTPETLRQCYFADGALLFSRLGHLDLTPNLLMQAQAIIEQAHKARQYLTTMRILARGEVLPVWALFDVSMNEALRQMATKSDVGGEELMLDLQMDVAFFRQKLQLPQGGLSWLDVLLAALFQLKLSNQYAPPAVLQSARSMYLARCIKFCSFAIMGLLAILLSVVMWRAYEIEQQWPVLQQQIANQTEQFKALPALPANINPQLMQAAVQLYQRDLADRPSAEQAAQRLSQVLMPYSQLSLLDFQWQAGAMDLQTDHSAARKPPAQSIQIRLRAVENEQQALQDITQLAEQLGRWPNAKVELIFVAPQLSAATEIAAPTALPEFILQLSFSALPSRPQ